MKNVVYHNKAVIIEIKSVRGNETLIEKCEDAIRQIDDMQYEFNLRNEGYKEIIKLGIAFKGKRCLVNKG